MSLNGVQITPMEQNRSLLNSVFKFKPTSLLSTFINKKSRIDKKCYTLAEVRENILNDHQQIFYMRFILDSDNIKRCYTRGGSL